MLAIPARTFDFQLEMALHFGISFPFIQEHPAMLESEMKYLLYIKFQKLVG